jgi:hypothetical protein
MLLLQSQDSAAIGDFSLTQRHRREGFELVLTLPLHRIYIQQRRQ